MHREPTPVSSASGSPEAARSRRPSGSPQNLRRTEAPPLSHNAPSAGGRRKTDSALSRSLPVRRCARAAAGSAQRVSGNWKLARGPRPLRNRATAGVSRCQPSLPELTPKGPLCRRRCIQNPVFCDYIPKQAEYSVLGSFALITTFGNPFVIPSPSLTLQTAPKRSIPTFRPRPKKLIAVVQLGFAGDISAALELFWLTSSPLRLLPKRRRLLPVAAQSLLL